MRGGLVYGGKCSALLASYDPESSSWRTCQTCFPGMGETGRESFSGRWPRAGLIVNGALYRLKMQARPTCGSGRSLWHTPKVPDAANRSMYRNSRGEPQLSGQVKIAPSGELPPMAGQKQAVKMWPTPQSQNSKGIRAEFCVNKEGQPPRPGEKIYDSRTGKQVQSSLDQCMKAGTMWPTPTKSDGMGGPGSSGRDGGENLRTTVLAEAGHPIGQLNPTWVEWLMGFPLGWTDLDA